MCLSQHKAIPTLGEKREYGIPIHFLPTMERIPGASFRSTRTLLRPFRRNSFPPDIISCTLYKPLRKMVYEQQENKQDLKDLTLKRKKKIRKVTRLMDYTG